MPALATYIFVTTAAALATSMDTNHTIAGATNSLETHVDEPSLRTVTLGVSDDAAIDAPVPEVRVTAEERFKDFDMNSVTHVVIQ